VSIVFTGKLICNKLVKLFLSLQAPTIHAERRKKEGRRAQTVLPGELLPEHALIRLQRGILSHTSLSARSAFFLSKSCTCELYKPLRQCTGIRNKLLHTPRDRLDAEYARSVSKWRSWQARCAGARTGCRAVGVRAGAVESLECTVFHITVGVIPRSR
jgi:hypothetical protein